MKTIPNKRHYSTSSLDKIEFFEWFVGFCDAESNFSIVPHKDKLGLIKKFTFVFKIGLHKDDYSALNDIKANLNLGIVSLNKDECKFVVTKKEDIFVLLSIFDRYPLKTSKRLDYLDFKKAFILYCERDGLVTQ